MDKKSIYIIMGVSGCGKTTVGKLLANALQVPFFDGDDFHSKANVAKMEGGTPLNDEDRKGWLQSLNALSVRNIEKGAVIACSALKETHRILLKKDIEAKIIFVHLLGTFDIILARLRERKNHYMPIDLLKSQLDILEPPIDAITVSIANTPEKIVSKIVELTK
jgi:gluconokinase